MKKLNMKDRLCECCVFEACDLLGREPNTAEAEHWFDLCYSIITPCVYFNQLYMRPADDSVEHIHNDEGEDIGYNYQESKNKIVGVINIGRRKKKAEK